MRNYLDFAEIKKNFTYEQTAAKLKLNLKTHGVKSSGNCPRCKSGDRALVITEGRGWYCFKSNTGGDQISLVAHILDVGVREAAEFLAGTSSNPSAVKPVQPSTVPESAAQQEGGKTFTALSYLESEHEAVHALNLCPEFAKKHGIGYAPRGTMKGHVLFPFRDKDGNLLGYVGTNDCLIPADFTPNAISLDKKRA
jgi:hypothetical protein